MELITLNTWGGRLWPEMSKFLSGHSSTDIFCFQEVNKSNESVEEGEVSDLYEKISEVLSDHKGYFHPQVEGVGHATFIHNSYSVDLSKAKTILSREEMGHLRLSDGRRYYPRIVQVIGIEDPQLTIYNFHGLPGAGKNDIPERDLQAERLTDVLNESGLKILAGDFNLNPDTKCMSEIEEGLVNLVKENNAQTTRSSYYAKKEEMPFADYILVSTDIEVRDFEVMQEEVSDHLALRIKFEK